VFLCQVFKQIIQSLVLDLTQWTQVVFFLFLLTLDRAETRQVELIHWRNQRLQDLVLIQEVAVELEPRREQSRAERTPLGNIGIVVFLQVSFEVLPAKVHQQCRLLSQLVLADVALKPVPDVINLFTSVI
jgi:hypothetical protein